MIQKTYEMAVKFKASPVRSRLREEGKVFYIARACERETIDFRGLARLISERSTASRADVALVLTALGDLIPELLTNNYSIHLKPLGVFSLSLKSRLEEKPEEVDRFSVTGAAIQFRPDKEMKEIVREISLQKT